ncbi:hypothetical protein JL722_4682 [Aureococcus anophagefferens]|nr:hypothetical protein JL722_4682 [Aureococcus anophagefferens]
MKSSSAGEGSKSLSGFFNRSVTLSDLQADPRRDVGDLGSRRLQPTAEPIPEALFGFDGQAWDAGQYAREGPGSKGRYDAGGTRRCRRRSSRASRRSWTTTCGPSATCPPRPAAEHPQVRAAPRAPLPERHGRRRRPRPAAQSVAETIDRIASQPAGESEVATDYLACCSTVEAAFDERRSLTAAVSEARSLEGEVVARPGAEPADARGAENAAGSTVAGLVGLSYGLWRESREALAASIFEQKWANMTCAELAGQVTVGCLEHGRLLEKVRARFGGVFDRVCRLHSDALWHLDAAVAALGETRSTVVELTAARRTDALAFRDKYDAGVAALRAEHAAELQAKEAAAKDDRLASQRMGETLRTLNAVFRDMQADTEGVSKSDLRDKIARLRARLQAQLKDATEELCDLRPLKEVAAKVPMLEKNVGALHLERSDLKKQLLERETVIAALQATEAERLRQEELAATNEPLHEGELAKGRKRESTQPEGDDDEDEPGDGVDVGDPLSNVLCIKCKKSLNDMANIHSAIEGDGPAEPPRLVCHAYRLLLPNIGGHRPPRHRVDPPRDARRRPRDHGRPRHARADAGRPVALPEFVYAYFEPKRERLDALDAVERRGRRQSRRRPLGLYYGVKLLSRESDEAKLFWSLLDESHGTDFLAFYLYCVTMIRKTATEILRDQGDVCYRATSYEARDAREHRRGGGRALAARRHGAVGPRLEPPRERERPGALAMGGQQNVWLPLKHAVEATEQILIKANPKLRRSALEATREIAVAGEGRTRKWGSNQMECVDLALWLRILTHLYREEQAHRRAAVRLMFETALAGTIAAHAPDYGTGRAPEPADPNRPIDPHEPPPCVDLPQFVSIVRTLWPTTSTVYACNLYREAHTQSKGRVDYEVFLETAERCRFFAHSLALPHYVAATPDFPLPQKERFALGALVHMRERMIRPLLERVEASLPDGARARFVAARTQFDSLIELNEDGGGAFHDIDGVQPLAAYRRLLQLCADARYLSYELGMDDPEGSGDAGGFAERLRSRTLTPGDFVVTMLREMRHTELVLIDFHEPPAWTLVQRLQLSLAVSRVEKSWRRREVVEWRLHLAADDLTLSALPFPRLVHALHVHRVGIPSVAERLLHDLYYNCKLVAAVLPRVRLFCIFSGVGQLPPQMTLGKKKPDADGALGAQRSAHEAVLAKHAKAALEFYVNAILLVRKTLELPPDGPLFHNSHRSGDGSNVCDFWVCGMSVLERAHQPRRAPGAKSSKVEILIGEMQGLRGPDDSGDVDAFLLLLMRHWAAAVLDREDKARTAAGSDAVVVGGAGGALQSSRAFDRAKTSLKIADLAPPVAPSSAQDIVGAMNFRRDALRHVKRDLGAAVAYSSALRAVEGGAEPKKAAAAACVDGLRDCSFVDMTAAWAYHEPMEEYLDAFEVLFTRGHDREIEEARAQLIMMKRAVDKFKSEAEKPSTATNVLKFHLFNDRWGQLRSLLDTIHKLRGIHVAYTTKQIDDGHVSRDDAEKDLVNVAGWGGSYEFVRDAWTRGSRAASSPAPQDQGRAQNHAKGGEVRSGL